MGASAWSYLVPYEPDLNAALKALRRKVLADGDYWWAEGGEFGKSASDYENRPKTFGELFAQESVQESGTHSIIDVNRVLADGEEPDYRTVRPVTPEEATRCAGTTTLTRDHMTAIEGLAERSWFARCAILHNGQGEPDEIYFWGFSGD
jgi:hypothetical protein